MSKHTPTPWVAGLEYTDEGHKARVFRNAAFQYALTEYGTMSDEDASYIVRAVNAHEGLVRALASIAEDCRRGAHEHGMTPAGVQDIASRCDAALSAAKE